MAVPILVTVGAAGAASTSEEYYGSYTPATSGTNGSVYVQWWE